MGDVGLLTPAEVHTGEYSSEISFPRNILATKTPPGLRMWVTMVTAANINWA